MIADAAGNELNIGDFLVYATGTRSSALSFAVILDIKEDRAITRRDATSYSEAATYEIIKVRVKLERRNSDGTLVKETSYPNGYDAEPVWTGKYLRNKSTLADQNTIWDRGDNVNSPKFGQVFPITRYLKVDNIVPEQ